jgi:LuxR family transcriptional regulator, maltose regulon positive regulatory protein
MAAGWPLGTEHENDRGEAASPHDVNVRRETGEMPAMAMPTRPGALVTPPLPRSHVPRPRLDTVLEAAVLDAALVLVSAPAGSGKSSAVSGWLARRDGGGAWYSLDVEDNDPALFWPSIAAALHLAAIDTADARWIATSLVEQSSGPVVVVLDDYHLVSNPVIHAGVDQLLVEAPAALRLVIATRHDPPLALSRLRSHGALRELRFDELRFDTDETAAVFGRIAGGTLPPLHAQRLVERTEGWVAAIQLVGLSAGVSDDPTTVVDAFTADHRHVFDYFRDEVIASLSDRLRAFLVDTAVLERLCAPLCDAVTGAADGQQLLEELERRNLFVVPLDQRRRWFRYHHLFAEWLRLHVDDPLPRHRAAADWLLANGHTGDAVRHLLAAGDTDRAAAVIEDQRWILIGQGRGKTLRDWVHQLPPAALRTRPGLTLAAAWAAHHAGDWDAACDLAVSIEPVDDLTRAEVLVLEAGRLIANDDADQALATVRAALPLVPMDEPRARTSLLLIQGRALLAGDDLDGAAASFMQARQLGEPYGLSIVSLIAKSHLAEIHRRAGRPADAMAAASDALRFADAEALADHPEAAVAHLTLAELLLDNRRPDDAAHHFNVAEPLVARVHHVPRERQADAVRRRLASTTLRRNTPQLVEQLTGRETSVLRLLPSALTPREIATELYLSPNTIKTHTRGIYRKLGVNTRHEAVEAARKVNLL